MKTQELYKCIDFIMNWQYLDDNDHRELIKKGDMFGESHIEPLRRELMANLFNLDHQQQTDLIIFYVRELNRVSVQGYLVSPEEHQEKDANGNLAKYYRVKSTPETERMFFMDIQVLFVLLFKELELICKNLKIPLVEILKKEKIILEPLFIYESDINLISPEKVSTLSVSPSKAINAEQTALVTKPTFKAEAIEIIFPILKDFFSPDQQDQLLEILKTGSIAKTKLIFFDNGIRLADLFRKLLEHDFIVRCGKNVLQQWIFQNFNFKFRNKISPYSLRTIEKYISTNEYPCKSPLIKIEKGEIIKVILPHYKKYNN